MHYLDNAATTRVLPEAAEAAVRAMLEEFGNPSSLHRMGREAAQLLAARRIHKDSRKTIASALGCLPEEVYFTACGTESTNISLHGAAHLNRHKKGRIIVTEIEHAATINTAKQLADSGFDVVFLAPDATGHITPEVLSEALTEDTVLLSCQLVNNEIGTVQPVEQLGKLLKAKAPKALFHIDAVQGLCRVRLTPKKWSCADAAGRNNNMYPCLSRAAHGVSRGLRDLVLRRKRRAVKIERDQFDFIHMPFPFFLYAARSACRTDDRLSRACVCGSTIFFHTISEYRSSQ